MSDIVSTEFFENKYPLLSRISDVTDLRKLPLERLPQLCAEIRAFIIENCSTNPGHFASSMGAVDIIVAVHYVFDTPIDHLVFDVGHQAYSHKILTGRLREFKNQRTKDGISGFPSPIESKYDTFVAGHAGNSISAALGMAIADATTPGNENKHTVALIGDASISNGLAFEGLNNVSNNPNNLLIILNDNNMSIDDNVGALHKYLSRVNTLKGYNLWRHKTYNFLKNREIITDSGRERIIRFNNSLKALISHQQNIFEGLNIRYFGPFDGHDVIEIVRILQEIKDMKGPRLLHLHTVKGKGFSPAEADPTTWHAPGKFDPNSGQRAAGGGKIKWQDIFGKHLLDMAYKHDDIVGITAAMPSGTSLSKMLHAMPQRAFDVGISEGHAVTFAGGLAAAGKHPFVVIYSSFLQRAYDNIIHDVAIQHLPVTFCIDRAGLVGEDGATHHGLLDIAYLRCIPGMDIAVPSDALILQKLMDLAYLHHGPMAIRYPRGAASETDYDPNSLEIKRGKAIPVLQCDSAKIALLPLGPVLKDAIEAANILKSNHNIDVDIFDMIWVKPLDENLLSDIMGKYDYVITIEDGTVVGGFGAAISEFYSSRKDAPLVKMLGIEDKFMSHATVAQLKAEAGIDTESIKNAVLDCVNHHSNSVN